jgi:type VI secretion system secreted protein VgrG
MATAALYQAKHFTGEERFLRFTTTPMADALVVRSASGREALSELFRFDIDLASEDLDLTASKLIAQPGTLKILFDGRSDRLVNGYISQFSVQPSNDCYAHYRVQLVPWLWFLTRTTNCAIFQNQTVEEILEAVFSTYQLHHFRINLQRKHPSREYCVQYRETAYDFVARLMAEEGIFFYFEHEEDKHTLVVSDNPATFQFSPLSSEAKGAFGGSTSAGREEGRIFDWVRRVEVRPRRATQVDYQFKTPRLRLQSTAPTVSKLPVPDLEQFDYPGGFSNPSDGNMLTDIRMEEQEADVDVIRGSSGCRSFIPGYAINVANQFRASEAGAFLVTAVQHQMEQGLQFTELDGHEAYQNDFTCIPRGIPFRPRRTTRRPRVEGPQTAFVTGPPGEEIYTDSYGRIRVQFHWDRQGKYDGNSACWVRVAQPVAGKAWGSMSLPRVGQEVIVNFLEGDPDRPLVTGCVYNADQTPPYKLPDNRSITTFKSYSYPGGDGFNELRFEDKKGKEQVFVHGEKDLHIRIKNDRREWIGRDRHLIVKRDKLEEVDRDKSELVQRDHFEQIQRDHHLKIQGKEAIQIGGSLAVSVTGDVNEQFSGSHSEQVSQSYYVKGMNVVIEAITGLTIKVGENFITINPAGIQVVGTMVMINSGGAALSGIAGNLVSPAAPAQAAEADNADPGAKADPLTAGGANGSSNSDAPWHNANSPENKDKKSWIAIELMDTAGKPVPGEAYRVTLPDGSTVAEGTLDEKGRARVDNIDPGTCKVTFPRLDKKAWKPK